MSITDELRDWVRRLDDNPHLGTLTDIGKDGLRNIADFIDAAHKKALYEPMDRDLTEHGWVKPPVDADGVPIRIGDELDACGRRITAIGVGNVTDGEDDYGVFAHGADGYYEWFNARFLHHVQPDTWERIIGDAANLVRGDNESVVELVQRCRRLAGEGA